MPSTISTRAKPEQAASTTPLKRQNVDVERHTSLSDIPAAEWNRLAGPDYPFLRHDFLLAAEQTGCVSAATGWKPRHLTLHDAAGLRAAMPVYEKSHSWGEFTFDWAWAEVYRRNGIAYYPKLVAAVPFTPASSPRLLLRERGDTAAASALLRAATVLAADSGCSSVHVLFAHPTEVELLRDAGFKLRKDCQFHWSNRGFRDFEHFLDSFSAKKRKKARRDRRHVAEAGVRYRQLTGDTLDDETLQEVYRLISLTFLKRGAMPYFDLKFFRRIVRSQPERVLVIAGFRQRAMLAAAIFFRGTQTLYGRYWGTDTPLNALHFETCYYQGIDYCIEHGIARFEPGTQGEHKVSRGFEPTPTWSAHWLRQPELFAAIGDYLEQERRHVERYMDAVDAHSPYKAAE